MEGDQFMNSIVTGDESWAHHYEPESKRQSMQWHHLGSPSPKKFKSSSSAGKVMMTGFWDHRGVIFTDFLPKGETVNSRRYCDTLKKLARAIRVKRPSMQKVILHHTLLVRPQQRLLQRGEQYCRIQHIAQIWHHRTFTYLDL